jgi:hypothetical protein
MIGNKGTCKLVGTRDHGDISPGRPFSFETSKIVLYFSGSCHPVDSVPATDQCIQPSHSQPKVFHTSLYRV